MNSVKTIILLLVVAFPLFIQGQTTEQRKNNKFSIGISFSPDYSYRNLHMKSDENNFVDSRNDIEEPRLGFTTGLVAKYRLNEKFTLESGVQIADKGERTIFKKDDFVDEFGNPVNDPAIPNKSTIVYHYKYVAIPLKINYYFVQRKAKVFFSIGSSIDFFLDGKWRTVLNYDDRVEKDKFELEDYDFNKISFVGSASLGIEKDISKRLELRFEPTFRYSFTPIVDAPLSEYLYSIGANIVLFYKY